MSFLSQLYAPSKWQRSQDTHLPTDGLLVSILRPHSSMSIMSNVLTSALPEGLFHNQNMSLLCRFICQYALSQVVEDAFLRKSRRCSALTMLEGLNGAIVGSIFNKNARASAIVPSGCTIRNSANRTRCCPSTWRSAM